MSFCPTKDIHSVYLDNELPEVHKAEYEKHLSECPKCRAELAELEAIREIFKKDSESITPDKQFMEDSYNRLMIKMSYNKNSVKANKKSPFMHLTYIISAAAAAVMLALFIPVGLSSRKNTVVPEMTSVQNMFPMTNFGNNISFGSGNNMVISGNMNDMLSQYVSRIGYMDVFDDVDSLDLLRPDFVDDNKISIRITVPKVGDIPLDSEIATIGIVLSGNYEWNHLEN